MNVAAAAKWYVCPSVLKGVGDSRNNVMKLATAQASGFRPSNREMSPQELFKGSCGRVKQWPGQRWWSEFCLKRLRFGGLFCLIAVPAGVETIMTGVGAQAGSFLEGPSQGIVPGSESQSSPRARSYRRNLLMINDLHAKLCWHVTPSRPYKIHSGTFPQARRSPAGVF